jgi:CheY-like chemotaxis protein
MAAATNSAGNAMRSAVLASADADFRRRVGDALSGLRWQVREAKGGAEALAGLEKAPAETVVLDSWLPDLEIREFVAEFRRLHPEVDLVTVDASMTAEAGARIRGAMRCCTPCGAPRRRTARSGIRLLRNSKWCGLHGRRRPGISVGAAWKSLGRRPKEKRHGYGS